MAQYTRQQYIDGLNRAYKAGDIQVVNELGEVLTRMDAQAAQDAKMAELKLKVSNPLGN